LRDVSRAITENLKPQIYPVVEKVSIDNKSCIRVQFEGDEPPYFSYGRAFIRVADESKQLAPAELEKFFKKKLEQISTWDSAPSGKSAEDINTNALRSYMKSANECGRLEYRFSNRDDILTRLELLDATGIANAAIAMFGKKATAEIQMAIFATDVKHTFIDIDRRKGTISEMVDAGEMYIRRNIRWRVVRDGSPARTEVPEVPLEAVREALLNSFAHRDWRIPQTNEIAIYSNRIEIYNPGTFPEGFTPQDFIDGTGKSIRRNPLLAQIMYYSKDIEGFGTGLHNIATECEASGVRYGFELGKLGFSVIFYRSELYGEALARNGVDLHGDLTSTGQDTGQVTGQDTGQVTGQDNRSEALLAYCKEPKMRKEMQEYIGVLSRGHFAKSLLRPLLESGQLLMTLPDKPNSRNQKYVAAHGNIDKK
jgi:ATP-dependent DNA helicase RecG